MNLNSSLLALGDGSLPVSCGNLKSKLPLKWIRSCLANNGIATVRRRKLPVEQIAWLLVGMALYRNRSIAEIVDRLDLVVPDSNGKKQYVSKAAITPARNRLGVDPMKDLFETSAKQWGNDSSKKHTWHDLRVFAIDGTTLRVPDSPNNRKTFQAHCDSGYPLVRLVVLMSLRSRIILNASFSGCRTSETTLANELLASIPDMSVTVLDAYFHNFSIWEDIRSKGSQRHWLVRAREDLRKWQVIERLGPDDEIVEIHPSTTTLTRNPELPEVIRVRAVHFHRKGHRPKILLTSLLDPKKYPASEIAALYHERWEIETAYAEIKTTTLERKESIRSKTPARIKQEIWGLLIAYNLIRRQIEATAAELKIEPNRISFSAMHRLMRDLFFWAEVASPGKLPKMLRELRFDIRHFILPPRRERTYSRTVKRWGRKYPIRRAKTLK